MTGVPRLGPDPEDFPPTQLALDRPNGLLAWGGELSTARLLAAYRRGIFPWYGPGEPLMWWSPAPRCVLVPDAIRLSARQARQLRQRRYAVTADTDFAAVIAGCAAPRPDQDGTWITPELRSAFERLHHLGYAHCIEIRQDRRLVGGIYGLALGRVFFAESMFHRAPDAGRMALLALADQLRRWDFALIDCQMETEHLVRQGAVTIEREAFEALLVRHVDRTPPPSPWTDAVKPPMLRAR